MKRLLLFVLIVLTVTEMAPVASLADPLFRWVDEQGVVHFSESPPPTGTPGVETRGSAPRHPLSTPASSPDTESAAATRIPGSEGLLWRVEALASEPSYLLGTIHVGDSRVLELPSAVEEAFASSGTFCLELIPDLGAIAGVTAAMLFTEGGDLETLIGQPWYGKAVEAMAARGIPEFAVARMKPWAVMTTLSTPSATGAVLDTTLYQRAVEGGKQVVGLETTEEQLGVFEAIPMRDQAEMLRETLRHLDELPSLLDAMVEAYVARDLGEIARLAETSMSWGSRRIADALERDLITRRNRLMVERMLPHLRRGGAFVAVGALHLPGDGGIVSLLRGRGIHVVPAD